MNTSDYQTSLIQEEQTSGHITMAAPADTSGQTGGMQATKADLSSVMFLADMNEMMIKQPVRGKEVCIEQCLGCEMSNFYEAEKVTEDGNKKTGRDWIIDARQEHLRTIKNPRNLQPDWRNGPSHERYHILSLQYI